MTRDAEKVVLEYLRRLDRRLEVMAADTRDLKIRITLIEQGLALVNQRVDRVVQRLTKIGLISWKSERSASVWRCDMPILAALGILLLLALVFGPSWWVRRVLAKHGADRPDLPGTGGEFARHLLDELKMSDVKVEITDKGDHYDPEDPPCGCCRSIMTPVRFPQWPLQHTRSRMPFSMRGASLLSCGASSW